MIQKKQNLNLAAKKEYSFIKSLLIFLAIWQFSFKVSNNAMHNLLRFMKFFIKAIGMAFYNKEFESSSDFVPTSFKSFHKSLKGVCRKCDSLYDDKRLATIAKYVHSFIIVINSSVYSYIRS